MKALLTLAAITAAGVLAAPALADRPTGEEKLARMLEGRVAGEPSSCVNTLRGASVQIIDRTAIVVRDGRTLWVNRTAHPQSLDSDDYLVIRHMGGGSRLCRLDNVTTQDRTGNFFTGAVFLEDFVPYRRAEG
jgi:hypothetical protein